MAPETGAQAEFLTVYFCTNGVGTLSWGRSLSRNQTRIPVPGRSVRLTGSAEPRTNGGSSGLASELTSRGASTTDVMLAGNWKTSRMVAHYSAGATAERGAVARYL